MKNSVLVAVLLVVLLALYFIFSPSEEPSEIVVTPAEETPTESEATPVADEELIDAAVSADLELEGAVKEFTIDAFSFGYSQEELVVNEGDTVTINLTNSEGFHDWVIDEFGAATKQIAAGETTSVTFVADEAGTYEYYCSVGEHRANGMVGTLVVQ